MPQVTTQMASPKHLPSIQQLIRALSAFHGDTAQVSLEQLQTIFFGNQPKGTAWIAIADRQIIGYAGLLETVAIHSAIPRFDIHHLFVVDAWRSKGIGKQLIAATKAYATDRGARGLTIGTDPRNASAQRAYRAMGLEEITDAGPRFWIPIVAD